MAIDSDTYRLGVGRGAIEVHQNVLPGSGVVEPLAAALASAEGTTR